VFLNPYDGRVLKVKDMNHDFFHIVFSLHYRKRRRMTCQYRQLHRSKTWMPPGNVFRRTITTLKS
jgi:hypothetical protein